MALVLVFLFLIRDDPWVILTSNYFCGYDSQSFELSCRLRQRAIDFTHPISKP